MSPSPFSRLIHDFLISTVLSFLSVIGGIHILLHILNTYFTTTAASGSGTLASSVLPPAGVYLLETHARHIIQISDSHSYLVTVFEMTVACTVILLAVHEVIWSVGCSFGWWSGDNSEHDISALRSLEEGFVLLCADLCADSEGENEMKEEEGSGNHTHWVADESMTREVLMTSTVNGERRHMIDIRFCA
ncbi:unnamed protein product [Mycena citricolor]|uniref:Uncharacterized protein n=1 Tax=Mycena citricolor TaxID=2018698 RepID=A0AAD2HK50_9AGAR|nr:unnamed protein product [Mycena citricolor]